MKNLLLVLIVMSFAQMTFAQQNKTKLEKLESRSVADGTLSLVGGTASVYSYGVAKTYEMSSDELIEIRKTKIRNSEVDGFEQNEEKIVNARSKASFFKKLSKLTAGFSAIALIDLFLTQEEVTQERKNTHFINDTRKIPTKEVVVSKEKTKTFTCEE